MTETRAAKLRRLWLNVHLWIGIGLAVLLIPISISGGLLVFHDDIDALLHPQRYAVSGPQVALAPSAYLAKAAEAVRNEPGNLRVTGLRFPEASGKPVQAIARGAARDGGRPRVLTIYLDPPTGAVLDVMDFRASFFGFMHVFHENLTLPQYSGRQIVGWAGTGMLILSLTGIWLWWPRNAQSFATLLRGLRWGRSPRFTFNLHHLLGFWIALPLAAVSFTGIYLSFPQTARSVMSSIAPMNTQGPRGGFGEVARQLSLTADAALEATRKAEPDARPLTLFLLVQARGERAPPSAMTWRIQMERAATGENITVMIDDRSGQAAVIVPQAGDRAASWMRWIHEGSHSGRLWAFIVFLTGIFPTVFAITGTIMWLRKRAARKSLQSKGFEGKRGAPHLRPAE
ncbi:MAG TPA: PepSY-associated TM helix domain-containing protein [Pseudolabrys sp.]|nr:PepSY-associated TM helix domain-containing protein [Pseudolabrys sp.]